MKANQRMWLAASMALVMSFTAFGGLTSGADETTTFPGVHQNHVANEIIVKFKDPAARALEQGIPESSDSSHLGLTSSLKELNKRYHLTAIKPLFRGFKENRERLITSLKKRENDLSRLEKRIVRRLKRAPKQSAVPALDRIYKLRFNLEHNESIEDVADAYSNDPGVEYAELNYIISINLTPNDPLYPLQWSLNNTGQMYPESGQYNSPPGTPDCDIDASEAWDIYTGYSDVTVAVVDTGVDYQHRDLDDNMWVNSGEIAGNGIDDDNNGYVDDIYGYDFINGDSDPMDDNGHGTHCAGIIAAEGNTDPNCDIAGVCWTARIMALKFLDSDGYGSASDAVTAFYYAVANGADTLSNSWGGVSYSYTLEEAIDYAHSQGVIMVAAAGNDDGNEPEYPGAYEHIISVAATNSNDEKAPFSNYGEWVDIAAPGVDVLSLRAGGTSMGTTYDDYTTIASGTSMACPHVAGACALLLSVNPLITCDEVYDILIETVDPIAPEICKSGRLNLHKAIAAAVPSKGYIGFDRHYYACSDVVSPLLIDYDLRGHDTQAVNITTSGGDSETLLLTKDVNRPGLFTGAISTYPKHVNTEDGKLQVQHDQIITVLYEDVNDGTGEPAVATDIAMVDCVGPVVSQVQTGFPGREPRIFFETDEPTTARVRCGLACRGPYIIEEDSMHLTTSHSIRLVGMSPETEYFYIVEATDRAGNLTIQDNGGACYYFTTTGVTDIHVPLQCSKIQEAIDNSWDGGMVLVADGTYTGPGNRDIDFLGRAIRVSSENGPNNCIIDCQGNPNEPHSGFYFQSGEDACSVLEGFTITNGYAPDGLGGGIKCVGSSPSIDNCIIRGNRAEFGGGVDNSYGSSPTFTNCVFQENTAERWGGGMENWMDCNTTLINCSFTGNAAGDGGAMCNDQGSEVTSVDCTFNGNSAIGIGGGGVGNYQCDPRYINCTFNHNIGEGMYNYGHSPIAVFCQFNDNSSFGMQNDTYSTPTAINCTFSGNGESGMHNGLKCAPEVTNCVFSGNGGYGMKNLAGNDGPITNCTFTGNKGGLYNRYSIPVVTNCILWGNGGTKEIEQICNIQDEHGSVIINYCCVQGWTGELGGVGNFGDDPLFADADGADDVYGTADDNPRLLDGSPCIDAGDNRAVPVDITDLDGDSDFKELLPWDLNGDLRFVNDPYVTDTGEIDPCNPQYPLVDIGAFEGVKQGFLVSTKSVIVQEGNSVTFTVALLQDPCGTVEANVEVESGDPNITVTSGELLTFDSTNYYQGQPVTLAATRDDDMLQDITLIKISAPGFIPAGVRAIEGETVPFPTVLYVDSRATGGNNGFSWSDAFIDLQEALRFADSYSHQFGEIRVGEGIYKPTVPGGDPKATFELVNGVALRGGYAGFGTADPNERDIEKYETTLSGDLLDNDTTVADPMDMYDDPCRTENIWCVVNAQWVDETAVLDGFTLKGAGDDIDMAWEGAVYIWFAGPTLINCTLRANIENGLFSFAGHARITNCKFIENAGYIGGGMNSEFSELILTNCTFSGNCSSHYGGGIYNFYSMLDLNNCTFCNNSAGEGGGVYSHMGDVNLTNCTFSGNICSEDGGGAYFKYGTQSLAGCIFAGNSAANSGGGIFNLERTTKLSNCTFYGNKANSGGGMYLSYWAALDNCIFWGNQDDTGISESAQVGGREDPIANYSCIQGWTGIYGGTGNMGLNPLFSNPENDDYHLMSEKGRWDPCSLGWISDAVTSPCIDKGDPGSDWMWELWPHGKRINMGAFGGTPEASMSLVTAGNAADLNNDGSVNRKDLLMLLDVWLVDDILLAEDINRDSLVNFLDFARLAQDWLWK